MNKPPDRPRGDADASEGKPPPAPPAYCFAVYDTDGALVAAEFIRGLPSETLAAIERWAGQGYETRIRRV